MIKTLDELDAFKPYLLLEARITRRDWFRLLGKLHQADSGCIIWLGAQTKGGYGVVSLQRNRKKSAIRVNRLMFEIVNNCDILPDIEICHSCDNPSCVHPAHLWAGTRKQNAEDKMAKGRWRGGCPKGYFAGSRNNKAKLNHEAVAFILDQKKNKNRQTAKILAEKYSVDRETIYNIWRGKSWTINCITQNGATNV